uniref:Uncharacterized protein n=1 Tax=Anguilla anguilla TaxID=7936 RepID=A0A0E9QKH6_ANGAN
MELCILKRVDSNQKVYHIFKYSVTNNNKHKIQYNCPVRLGNPAVHSRIKR